MCSHERGVCKACYLVIESYLKGDSRKNENYLARFIKFFQQQVKVLLPLGLQGLQCKDFKMGF